MGRVRWVLLLLCGLVIASQALAGQVRDTNLYWGDTHLHTSLSGDAYLMKNISADPDTAYRFAKGLPVVHPGHGAKVQIDTPLDFLVVADHAEYMGVANGLAAADPVFAKTELGQKYIRMMQEGKGKEVYFEIVKSVNSGQVIPEMDSPEIRKSVWSLIIDAAEHHNEPGKFTSLIGWEWSSLPDGANLHRVVFLREDGNVAGAFNPYSMFDSQRPEDLWAWLDRTSEQTGATFTAIPHNSNISKGMMFAAQDSDGKPITAQYAQTRMRWEPVAEVTQTKGDSETHPVLSPEDEFADFETYDKIMDARAPGKQEHAASKGDYIRPALRRGLEIEQQVGSNPYKFGVVGSTDSHTGLSTAEEDNFWGKFAVDGKPANKGLEIIMGGATGYDMSSAGMAAVWAEENTREALFDAFRRKEVYGTTGPRIQVRLFGGWDYHPEDAYASDLARRGYEKGVPMGGDLTRAPQGAAPTFLVRAVKDPRGANLDRVQVVKGWVDADGVSHEKVFDVALSDGRKEVDGQVSPVGNTVDLKTATYTNTIGDAQLATVWADPEFDPSRRAFYYVRVLQIPTPRNSLYDAVALRQQPTDNHPPTIQERAYSSPIWYTP